MEVLKSLMTKKSKEDEQISPGRFKSSSSPFASKMSEKPVTLNELKFSSLPYNKHLIN